MDSDTPNSEAVEAYVKLCRELGVECCLEVLASITTPSRSCSLTDRASPLKDADIKCIAGMLRQYDVLDILNVEGNEIEQDGILSIANMLKKNTSLHTLRLGANKFRDGGVITLAHALSVNTTLTSLDLSHNRIGGVGVKALAQVLGSNSTITELVLHGNVVDAYAISHLCDALYQSKTMQHLHLGYNDLAGKGVVHLAKLLSVSPTLATLDISNNRVTDTECGALMEALATSRAPLERLNLRSNFLGEKTFTSLARALPHSNLREVFLGFNTPTPASVETVVSAACRAPQLRTLDIHGCKLQQVAPVCELVRSNGHFSCLLLDGITCGSEGEVAAQRSEWDRAWTMRQRCELADRWAPCYVGKEADKVDGGPSTGPAFFVGDKELEVKLIASGSTQVSASPRPSRVSSPSPVMPSAPASVAQSVPQSVVSALEAQSFVGKALPAANDDLVKTQLMSQVHQLELKLEQERLSHQMQLSSLEKRLMKIEAAETKSNTRSERSVSEVGNGHADLNISNATIPQQVQAPSVSPYPSPTAISRLRNERAGDASVRHFSPSHYSDPAGTSFSLLQQEAIERGKQAERLAHETILQRQTTERGHRTRAVHQDIVQHDDRRRASSSGSASVGMPGAHRCPSRSGRSASRSRSPVREQPTRELVQPRTRSAVRDRSPYREQRPVYLSPPAPVPVSVPVPVPVPVSVPVPAPAPAAPAPQPLTVQPVYGALTSYPLQVARGPPQLPPPVAPTSAPISLPHMQRPTELNRAAASVRPRSMKVSPVCPDPSPHTPLKNYKKTAPPKDVMDMPPTVRNVPLSALGNVRTQSSLAEPVRRGRSPMPMSAKVQEEAKVDVGTGPSAWQAVRTRQPSVDENLPGSRNPSMEPAQSRKPGLAGSKVQRGTEVMVSPQRSTLRRHRSPRPAVHELPTPSMPLLQDSKKLGDRGPSRLRDSSRSASAR